MPTLPVFVLAAFCEIAGCFAFWSVVRLSASKAWLIPGVVSLIAFAWLLTRADTDYAGRAYAVYGGIYIAASVLWLWLVESRIPDRWDVIGAAICIAGATVILFTPRPI